jgi:hypothetical protein
MPDEVLLRGAGRELVALSATLFEDMNPAWLLLTKNLRTRRPSKGLDNVKVGPFLILEQTGPVTYTLNLPPDVKVHPRFHVSLLEPADPSTPLQKTFHFQMEEDKRVPRQMERLPRLRQNLGTRHQPTELSAIASKIQK